MKQTALKYGIISGIGTMVYLLVFYGINKPLFVNFLVYWSSLLVPMIGMVAATRKVRDLLDGDISKKEALQTGFIVWVVTMLFLHLFLFIMFKYIDPELVDIQKVMMEEAYNKPINKDELAVTPGSYFFRFCFMCLPGFLLAWGMASFLKKQ